MPTVITLGELLIDFVPTVSGVGLIEAPAFQKAPGGAPANVAVGLARLGVPSGFMGKVGDDAFGHFLEQTLRQEGVDTQGLRFAQGAPTPIVFVALESSGERHFVFYRYGSADLLYAPEEVDLDYVRGARAFHFGSVSLAAEPVRGATLLAARTAHDAGLLVSYDPNIRLHLWPDAAAARAGVALGWELAQVIKVNEEELTFLSETDNEAEGVRRLWHPELRLLVVTHGAAGCRYFTAAFSGEAPGFAVEAVDTTGAGDGFMAGLLKGLLEHPRAEGNEALVRSICRYANAVGALTTTKRGAIPGLPGAEEVERLVGGQGDRMAY